MFPNNPPLMQSQWQLSNKETPSIFPMKEPHSFALLFNYTNAPNPPTHPHTWPFLLFWMGFILFLPGNKGVGEEFWCLETGAGRCSKQSPVGKWPKIDITQQLLIQFMGNIQRKVEIFTAGKLATQENLDQWMLVDNTSEQGSQFCHTTRELRVSACIQRLNSEWPVII